MAEKMQQLEVDHRFCDVDPQLKALILASSSVVLDELKTLDDKVDRLDNDVRADVTGLTKSVESLTSH